MLSTLAVDGREYTSTALSLSLSLSDESSERGAPLELFSYRAQVSSHSSL